MLLFCAAVAIAAPAQTFTSLFSFDGADGENPNAPLIQGLNGDFYGTTPAGGRDTSDCLSGCGTVFEITPAGKLTTLYSFCPQQNCPDGFGPNSLVQAINGNFYGTTNGGGVDSLGTMFEITPAGKLTTLHSFCSQQNCADGFGPNSLIQATNGNFYGTTNGGGANSVGTVFEITAAGELTTLYNFCSQSNCTDGEYPFGAIVQATNGNLYGVTSEGGANSEGTIFEITPVGKLTTFYSFCSQPGCRDGGSPQAGLVQAANGNFYGTTSYGGANAYYGTVFEITPAGTFSTLYSFCNQLNCPDGALPEAELVQGTDGNFYGTTYEGGANCIPAGCGTVFKITQTGKLTTLYSFCSQAECTDGSSSRSALVEATSGMFYGTTGSGGTNIGAGTVFRESMGLKPFIKTLPVSGNVGSPVILLGNDLAGATAVSFNGKAATFTVVSATEIETTVPTGATTGLVTVTTPKSMLTSNKVFRVQ